MSVQQCSSPVGVENRYRQETDEGVAEANPQHDQGEHEWLGPGEVLKVALRGAKEKFKEESEHAVNYRRQPAVALWSCQSSSR